MDASAFLYDLPDESIAQTAIEPRDASRLLVTATMEDRLFRDLPDLLRHGDVLVVNRTRVRAARIRGIKDSGGAIEALLLRRVDTDRWEALMRPSRRLRPGVGMAFGDVRGEVLSDPDRGVVTLSLTGSGDVEEWLRGVGEVPLPPYFHGRLADPDRYQTIFATTVGSAAAPTAALHFTDDLVADLSAAGIEIAEVELQVGLDTFRPMAAGPIEAHVMHREHYVVPQAAAETIARARARGCRIVAVGTTVMRTLETAAVASGTVEAGEGASDLFITPGYRPRAVDMLLTNFHAPGTTLVVLVAALVGDRWRSVYQTALDRGYRFLSFGDAMLIDIATEPA